MPKRKPIDNPTRKMSRITVKAQESDKPAHQVMRQSTTLFRLAFSSIIFLLVAGFLDALMLPVVDSAPSSGAFAFQNLIAQPRVYSWYYTEAMRDEFMSIDSFALTDATVNEVMVSVGESNRGWFARGVVSSMMATASTPNISTDAIVEVGNGMPVTRVYAGYAATQGIGLFQVLEMVRAVEPGGRIAIVFPVAPTHSMSKFLYARLGLGPGNITTVKEWLNLVGLEEVGSTFVRPPWLNNEVSVTHGALAGSVIAGRKPESGWSSDFKPSAPVAPKSSMTMYDFVLSPARSLFDFVCGVVYLTVLWCFYVVNTYFFGYFEFFGVTTFTMVLMGWMAVSVT